FAARRLEFQMILKGGPKLRGAAPAWFPPASAAGPLPRTQEAGRHASSDPDRGGELSQCKAFVLPTLRGGAQGPTVDGRPQRAGRAVGRGCTGRRLDSVDRVPAGYGAGL